ncbi:hypothetical protein MHYP_G00309300 [Metynnis hypsauchen]
MTCYIGAETQEEDTNTPKESLWQKSLVHVHLAGWQELEAVFQDAKKHWKQLEKLKQLRRSKEAAYRSGDRALYNQARNTLNKEIRVAKKSYSNKLSSMVSTNEPSAVWKCLQNITSYKRTPPQTMGDRQLADELNTFYCRIEKPRSTHTFSIDSHLPVTQPSIQPALKICEKDVQ